MKNISNHDVIYLASKDNWELGDKQDFNLILPERPINKYTYRTYISLYKLEKLLEKLKVVCGNDAMRFVEKQIKEIKSYY